MRRDDVSDSFLYINEIRPEEKCIEAFASRRPCWTAVRLLEDWMGIVEWGGVNNTSEKHSCCLESPRLLPNSSNIISIIKIALC